MWTHKCMATALTNTPSPINDIFISLVSTLHGRGPAKLNAQCSSFIWFDVQILSYGAESHHTRSESEAESGILPVFAPHHMTDSHLMEASLSKQTQYTAPLWDPFHTKKKKLLPQIYRDTAQGPLPLNL